MHIKIEGIGLILVDSMATYTPSDTAQVMDITTTPDVSGSLSEKFFYLFTEQDTKLYAFQMNMFREVTSIVTDADSGGDNAGKYFTMSSPSTDYYVWLNRGKPEITKASYILLHE